MTHRSSNSRRHVWLLVFLLAMLLSGLGARVYAASPNLFLHAAKQAYSASDDLTLTLTFQNPTNQQLQVLKWNTPLEGIFNSNMFEVLRDGVPVKYTGRIIKRRAPAASDYLTLMPGDTVSASIDLTEGYEITQKGVYTVSYRNPLAVKMNAAPGLMKKIAANAVTFVLEQDRQAKTGSATFFKQPSNYSSCSGYQIATLDAALTEAENITLVAKDALNNTPVEQRSTAQRYNTWFGAYTSSRYAIATGHFNNMYNALANNTISFHCDCSASYFAYVFSDQPYHIHLCGAFWSAPLSGTDSKSGTIVHEMSHFNDIAGTADYQYGQTDAMALAVSNPDYALDNADNHEYFAENTPSLSMLTKVAEGNINGAGINIVPILELLLLN